MPGTRTTIRLLANVAVLGVVAVPTGLAAAAEPSAPERSVIPFRADVAQVADAGDLDRDDAGDRDRNADGPDRDALGRVVPVVGSPDYGTAENRFGAARSGHVHAGQDIFASAGTPVVAAADGVIAERDSDGGQGNYVYLYDSARGQTYVYMHLIEPAEVEQGERVRAGERLGGVGCTGSCWGDHLHFEIRDGRSITATARDPLGALEDWQQLPRPR